VAESHEPGSTYKLAGLMALLDDKKVDTSAVYDSKTGYTLFCKKSRRLS
jgi:cell division protein FtsI (penicillin-binding protein 3)